MMAFWSGHYYLLLHLTLIFGLSLGDSVVEFSSTPTEVKEGFTSQLSLQCRLRDFSSYTSDLGSHDTKQTRLTEVMSVVVMKDGQTLAFVDYSEPAQVMAAASNIRVSVSTTACQSERGLLSLTISEPTKEQTGEFQCDVTARDESGTVVTMTEAAQVRLASATMEDLVLQIQQMNRERKEMTHKQESMLLQVQQVTREAKEMKKENEEMKQSIGDLLQQNISMNQEIADLKLKANVQVFFTAGLTKHVTLAPNQVLVFDKILVNVGGGYNNVTGAFVCPVNGYYLFEFHALSHNSHRASLMLTKNNESIVRSHVAPGNGYHAISQSTVIKLSKDDVVKVQEYQPSQVYGHPVDIHTTFTGLFVALP